MWRVLGPRGKPIILRATWARVRALLPALRRRFGHVRLVNLSPLTFTMYDAVNLDAIPANARAVAGYVNGRWPTYPQLAQRFQHARRLSIAVTADADADCLDVEPQDATIEQASAWVSRQHARGLVRPTVYVSLGQAAQLVATLARHGIPRSRYRLWTAHYTGRAHLCTAACGFGFTGKADATQYTDRALGRSLDASLCRRGFL